MGAEGRHLAREDLFSQCHQLLRGGLIPRLDGRAAGDGMEHPLGLFAQGISAALGELIRQLHQQILGAALFHISRHRA